MTVKIGINGMGRVGRAILRAIYETSRKDVQVVAINSSASAKTITHLLKYDSVHGTFSGEIKVTENNLYIGKGPIKIYNERDPSNMDWQLSDVDVVLECTGNFTKHDEASLHLKSGAKRVIISAPSANPDLTVVYGVNSNQLRKWHKIISVGSCTTNCLAPIAKVLHDRIGIESGHMTTIHAYTNDQNIVDNSHRDLRRARAANLSIIPTTTGAAETIGKIIPELSGKLSGVSMRVPVPNVSFIDFSFVAARGTTAEEINNIMARSAVTDMAGIIGINREELVSVDFMHNPFSAVFDLTQTHVTGGRLCRVGAWYDNEWAFALRMIDVATLSMNAPA